MQSQVQRFLLSLDAARHKVARMIYSETLDPQEKESLSCINDVSIIQATSEFLASIRFDMSLRMKPNISLQSSTIVEAKEALDLLNSAYIYAYDLLEYSKFSNISIRKLEKVISCMASILQVLPNIIEKRESNKRSAKRPAFAIIGHGELCNDYTFTVPRGCTVVVLTPPGGLSFAEIDKKWNGYQEKFNARFVDKIRTESNLGYYSVYYHEGSDMHDQMIDFSDPEIFSGIYAIPLSRRPKDLMMSKKGSYMLRSLVGSMGPGIYVVQACRVQPTMHNWKDALKRDVRAHGLSKLPDEYDICRRNMTLNKCKEIAAIPAYKAWGMM